jgi:uncharacterized protein (DUF1330 family)
MNANFKLMLAVVAGAAIGAVAAQGLHAQAKPKAYIVTETEVIDAAALAAYSPQAQAAIKAAGGRSLAPATEKAVALAGQAPKRVGISEWETLEKAQAWRSSEAWKALSPQRDKALKAIRAFAVEGAAN